jgi:hypothetical protein
VDIKDSNKEVQAEISKYLKYKVSNVRLSAKSIEGGKKTYKTEVSESVTFSLLYVVDGNLVTSTDFMLSISDFIFFIFWIHTMKPRGETK